MDPGPGRSGEEDSNTKITKNTRNSAPNTQFRGTGLTIAIAGDRTNSTLKHISYLLFLGDLVILVFKSFFRRSPKSSAPGHFYWPFL
jgi:hypothetical protein